jgi:hypothetical protein
MLLDIQPAIGVFDGIANHVVDALVVFAVLQLAGSVLFLFKFIPEMRRFRDTDVPAQFNSFAEKLADFKGWNQDQHDRTNRRLDTLHDDLVQLRKSLDGMREEFLREVPVLKEKVNGLDATRGGRRSD